MLSEWIVCEGMLKDHKRFHDIIFIKLRHFLAENFVIPELQKKLHNVKLVMNHLDRFLDSDSPDRGNIIASSQNTSGNPTNMIELQPQLQTLILIAS